MPVTSISYQPATGQLIAAYRPIVLKVNATATGGGAVPPFVVCDIYINDVYYKSIIRTAAESLQTTYSVFQFDISDALQESLQADLATINNNNLLQAPHMSGKVFCRFRSSDIDGDGFTIEEGTKPVQGTKFTSPVAGTGTQSNSFFVINTALQHEDNQNLALHLDAYKQGIWAPNAFPLTHRNRYYFCNNDSDHYPLIFIGDCVNADIILNYRLKSQMSFHTATAQDINICAAITFSTAVTGNQISVHLNSSLATGHYVLVQYKKQSDSVWITAGSYTTQDLSFSVNGSDIAGDYDIRVIHFCTACLSSDPATGTFTLAGTVTTLGWRGVNPFCVQGSVPGTIYIVLDLRNETVEETYFPNNVDPLNKTTTTNREIYAKFFSDANHLNPLSVVQNGLKVHVKNISNYTDFDGANFFVKQVESVTTYTGNANGVEMLLGTVNLSTFYENYGPYPTVVSYGGKVDVIADFTPYPTHLLIAGGLGLEGYNTLEEYNLVTNVPTGNYKPNDIGDPDYIAPFAADVCQVGPDVSTITLGAKLTNFRIEVRDENGVYYYVPYNGYSFIADSSAGGSKYVKFFPKYTNLYITLTAGTLDSGNSTGFVKCRVSYYNSNNVLQIAEFNVPNNIQTVIPQTFQNITNVNITNY